MPDRQNLTHGDQWTSHYRGYRLHVNSSGDVWWQLYDGTDRLHLQPTPTGLVDDLLDVKHRGGRVRITESNDVLTLVEEGDGYQTLWVGDVELEGELTPQDDPEYSIAVRPDGLSPGDLWPSVYDGARYSYSGGDRVWWTNPETHKNHPVETDLSAEIFQSLRKFKPDGGSFRVTPWGDVVTVVPFHPTPAKVEEQFEALPLVVRNIIKLRKERGMEMLPIYVGSMNGLTFEVNDPASLTDELSEEDRRNLEEWATSLGRTRSRTSSDHTTTSDGNTTGVGSSSEDAPEGANSNEDVDRETITFDDDPIEWQSRDFDLVDSGT